VVRDGRNCGGFSSSFSNEDGILENASNAEPLAIDVGSAHYLPCICLRSLQQGGQAPFHGSACDGNDQGDF